MAAEGERGHWNFDITSVVHPNRHTLVLSGELDISTAVDLQRVVAQVCADGARKVVLDLTGLRAVLASQSVCRDHGIEFVLTPASAAVRRVFEIAGLIDALPFARVAI